jgi:hypothetical protein
MLPVASNSLLADRHDYQHEWSKMASGMASARIVHGNIGLGPLTSNLLYPFPWKDDYPVWQEWADELEHLLSFADETAQIHRR